MYHHVAVVQYKKSENLVPVWLHAMILLRQLQMSSNKWQEAQFLQRGHVVLCVAENFDKLL